jgi:hypothetical protein
MQPPPPRRPVPSSTLGDHSQAHGAPTRHPQGPSDFSGQDDGGTSPRLCGTRDHALIRAWADHHGAEPATGQATESGPAVIEVNDQGAGVRFNFPAAARFRPLEWDEWFTLFDREALVFVFEARDDDHDASTLDRFGGAFYRLVTSGAWGDRPLSSCVKGEPSDEH